MSGLQAGRAKKNGTALLPLFRGGLTGKDWLPRVFFFFFQAFETSIPYNQYTNFIYGPQFVERGEKHGIVVFTSSIVTEQRYSWIFMSRSGQIEAYGRRTGHEELCFGFGSVCSHISLSSIQLTKRRVEL